MKSGMVFGMSWRATIRIHLAGGCRQRLRQLQHLHFDRGAAAETCPHLFYQLSHRSTSRSDQVLVGDILLLIERVHLILVWTFIWSLRREDAARLGYDHAESWRKLIKAHQVEIAAQRRCQWSVLNSSRRTLPSHWRQENPGADFRFEKAIRFYTGYLNTQNAASYLPRVLADVLEGKLGVLGTRIGKLLFKLAVEQSVLNSSRRTLPSHWRQENPGADFR